MNNQDNITISKYINGELEGEALLAFEKLLEQNKALKDEVNFHKIVDETLAENYQAIHKIDEGERLEFEGILSKVMDGELENENPDTAQIGIVKRLLPLAAIAAAAALLLFIFNPKLQNDDSSLADNFYQPYTYQRDPTLENNPLNKGFEAYQNKNYETALNIFNGSESGDLKLHLVKGNAEYNLEKYEDAIKTFNFVKDRTGNQSFKNYANWYLALTYLKKDDEDQTIKLLNEIPENADFYKQAQELIKELK